MMEIKLKNQAILFAASSDVITESIPYDEIRSLITDEEPYRVYLSTIKKEDSGKYINLQTGKNIINSLADNLYIINGLMRKDATDVIRYYLAYLHNKAVGIGGNGYDDKIGMSIKMEDITLVLVLDDDAEKQYQSK